jgi:Asp-tRNA(Asn)/Glu-tRNA(Gln) amidotransferase A subunit family amidase
MIPRTGTLLKSPVLDTVGVFGRSIEDIALLADTLAGHDENDAGSPTQPPPRLTALAGEDPPLDPTLAFVSQAGWATADDETRQGFDELTDLLGERCDPLDLPDTFQEAPAIHRTLLLAGLAGHGGRHCAGLRDTGVLADFEAGQAIPAVRYLAALDWREVLHAAHERLFDRYDAILTPAAAGEAKPGETETASSAFCTPWTLLGVPAVSLPLMEGPDGMPVGVQLVGRRGYDGRLLRTARWLVRLLTEDG